MKRTPLAAAVAMMALCCTLTAPATAGTPLQYDEALNGDLTPDGTVTELTLGTGHNVIKGEMFTIFHIELPNSPVDIDIDPVILWLPAGQQIEGMRVDFSFLDTTQNTLKAEWHWLVQTLPSLATQDNCFAVVGSPVWCSTPISSPGGDILGTAPRNDQRYLVLTGSSMLWADASKPVGGTMTYTLSIDVSPVPEPATALLALLGLPLLARASRARRA